MMSDPADHPSSPPSMDPESGYGEETLSDGSRWLAAISYLSLLVLLVLYETRQRPRDDFVRFHARQGFALCFAEIVFVVLNFILGDTLGTIPVLGAILMILFRLVVGLLAVGFSVWGFVEALGGQKWKLPILGEYAKRVPVR